MIDVSVFKQAMGTFPSGVVIATALDGAGRYWGFTASSFASVSLDPPLVLVCLAKTAECRGAFESTQRFSINILGTQHEALARRFATRGADKFAGDEFFAGEHGLPLIRDAVATLVCRRFAAHDCGDHTVLVGEVESVDLGPTGDAMVYHRQRFGRFAVQPTTERP